MLPDPKAMLLFAKVVQAGSYSKAARDLGVPKSTISRKISQMESELDVRLLQRNTRGLSLTQAGKQVFDNCLRVQREVESMSATVENLRQDVSGSLRIGMPVSFNQEVIANLCVGFLQKYPKVDLEVQFTDGDINLIAQGYDITVMFGPLPSSELIAKRLFERSLMLVASPSYLTENSTPVTLKDLSEHQGILLGNVHSAPIWPLGTGGEKSLVSFKAKVTVNSSAAIKQMVGAGLGIGLLTSAQCMQEIQSGQLIQVLENYPIEPLKAYGLFSSRFQLAPKITVFLNYFAEQIDYHETHQQLRAG